MRTPFSLLNARPLRLSGPVLLASFLGIRAVETGHGATEPANAPPTVAAVEAPETGFDTILIEVRASDPECDRLSFRVEYEVVGGTGEGWKLAKACQDERTEALALRGIPVEQEATPLAFFWDSTADLPDRLATVRLRFTPLDEESQGLPLESASFRVEND